MTTDSTIEERIKIAKKAIMIVRRKWHEKHSRTETPSMDCVYGCVGILDFVLTGDADKIFVSDTQKQVKKLLHDKTELKLPESLAEEEVRLKARKWKKAQKRPVVVEYREVSGEKEVIKTREGKLTAYKGKDFIIRGIEGEVYPISKEIFFKSYDILGEDEKP